MNSEDLFGTTPPRQRIRKKRQESKFNNGDNAARAKIVYKSENIGYDKEVTRGRRLQRNPNIPAKKFTEMRGNQRDYKLSAYDVFTSDMYQNDEKTDTVLPLPLSKSNEPGKQRIPSVSENVLTLQSPYNLRCLKSQVSSDDLFGLEHSVSVPPLNKSKHKKTKSGPKIRPNVSFQYRVRYMQRINKLIKGNTQKRDENVRRNEDSNQQYHSQWNELIWLELQAWHSDHSVIDTDNRLYLARTSIIPELLAFVVDFKFNKESIVKLDKMVTSYNKILKQIPEVDCEECTIYANISNDDTSNLNESNSQLDDDFPYEILSKLQNFNNGIESTSNFIPSKPYLDLQDIAIHKVGEILKELCIIENLYPSTMSLSRDYPFYNSTEFQEKVDLLCGWFNITIDLRMKFRMIMKKFRVMKDHLENEDENVYKNCGCEHPHIHPQLSDEFDSKFRTLCGLDPKNLNEENIVLGIAHLADRLLRQNSVTKILDGYLNHHLSTLMKVRQHTLPVKCIHSKLNYSMKPTFEVGEFKESTDRNSCSLPRINQNEVCDRIKQLLPNFDLSKITKLEKVEAECKIISPSNTPFAVFGLPSFIPIYSFISAGLLAIMRECIKLRLKQTNPDLLNRGSSSSLLTARQFVVECKEMLQCGLLTRDLYTYFIIDTNCEIGYARSGDLVEFDKEMSQMLKVYLEYIHVWLVGLLSHLPLAPRSFKDTLEQEWNFACLLSPRISYDSVVVCATKFTDTCCGIIETTKKFMLTAMQAIIESHNREDLFSSDQDYSELQTPDIRVTPSRQTSSNFSSSEKSGNKKCLNTPQAGVLWFHRQRSDSPHLSRKVSTSPLPSPHSSTSDLTSPLPTYRQYSFNSQDSSSNILRFLPNLIETRRRYYFELCRAVKEMFNEVRERAMRVLSFAKQLRKKLEPAIGFNILKMNEIENCHEERFCSFCQLLEYFYSEGYVKLDLTNLKLNVCLTDEQFNLFDYWIFLPNLGENTPTADGSKSLNYNQMAWNQIKSVLFSHLELQSNEDLNFQEDSNKYVSCMVFVKIPLSGAVEKFNTQDEIKSVNLDSKCRRASTDATMGKRRRVPHAKLNGKRDHKWNSDGNLLARDNLQTVYYCSSESCSHWKGDVIPLEPIANDLDYSNAESLFSTILKYFKFTTDFTVIMASADDLSFYRKNLTKSLANAAKLIVAQTSVVKEISDALNNMRQQIVDLGISIMHTISEGEKFLHDQINEPIQEQESIAFLESQQQVKSEVTEVLQSCFNFGFDFIKESSRIMSGHFRSEMDKVHLEFAKQWMRYIIQYRSSGTGHMPRWAVQGLKFVVSIEWSFIKSVSEDEFIAFQALIDKFVSHVIGEVSTPMPKQEDRSKLTVSPSEQTILRSLSNTSVSMSKEVAENVLGSHTQAEFCIENDPNDDEYYDTPIERIRVAIEDLEDQIDLQKQEDRIIGRITNSPRLLPVVNLGVRTVNFQWQRGTKIGEGSFGKVYTCVNVDTGTILAMKEIQFHPNDHQKIRSILDEITNFEGIHHVNLVQYYGVELHRQEMYIFMEYCDGGTLEEICKLGLPETMVRRYTSQILSALSVLHANGIVHRDIKGSNIFLTSSGQAKLGDFGSALKLRNKYKTTPGEISTHIGTTTAYTAPEVINGSDKTGYGRAADIWSLGCVVIEMASGKRPWHDLEPVQIMFKVGMDFAPTVPETLSPEGKHFLNFCLKPNPKHRWTCDKLIGHPFVKVINFEE